ncbi:hypothetical protein F3B42_14435 [Bacteroides ovatus]|jgi:hypothetical protein|nr:hypothetical protein F3B42_14435 [Bacteroides ovatus]KAA4680780.1 hypothetical protein F3B41_15725 [Bacteroides ovatus]DAP46186.1 MAG TPA: Nucleotide modification associated domain 2 [Caudoviricetes sp.]
MGQIYSYVLRYDDGVAPNPYGGVCTLAICKPVIRKKAQVGDWVIGTGSFELGLGDTLVYAMKITEVLSFKEYDILCRSKLHIKIPQINSDDIIERRGDCIYDYSKGDSPIQRAGAHNMCDSERDLSGINVLLSTHFYYFGDSAIFLPTKFLNFRKKGRGHRIIKDQNLVDEFEEWINSYELNRLFGEPQKKVHSCGSCSHNTEIKLE